MLMIQEIQIMLGWKQLLCMFRFIFRSIRIIYLFIFRHFHDETGQFTKNLHLNAGDDAEKVVWCAIDQSLDLYACHKDIIKVVVDRLNAYW